MNAQTAEAVRQLEDLMEVCKPARLTFPDGSYVTGQVVEMSVPGGSHNYARPSVVLHVYAGSGVNRRVDRVVIELREDALPTVEAEQDPLWPAWGPGSYEAARRAFATFGNMPRFSRTPQLPPETPTPAAVTTIGEDRLAARKLAEARIEGVFEQLDTDEQLALLFRLLRARGWSTDRANTVLAKARWNG